MTSDEVFMNWLKSVLEVVNINRYGTVEILDIKVKDGYNNNEVLSVIKEWLNEKPSSKI